MCFNSSNHCFLQSYENRRVSYCNRCGSISYDNVILFNIFYRKNNDLFLIKPKLHFKIIVDYSKTTQFDDKKRTRSYFNAL